MYFFTADEHYGHRNIIKYCRRPFDDTREMDYEITKRHNSVVGADDIVIHGGDLTLANRIIAERYITELNGKHFFLKGSHDAWLSESAREIWEKKISGQPIIVCHYAMRVWSKSHYGSWQLYGHSHGNLEPIGKQWDIGVDNNDFYPVSFEQIVKIMKDRPDNPNFIGDKR